MNEVARVPEADGAGALALSPSEVKQQVNALQHLMKQVMREETHFGTIPGTPKPTLYKPGAEKICLMFGLAASFTWEREDLKNGHREYTVRCHLRSRSGRLVAEGIGVCSTMESKYRYRWDSTDKPVPKAYWDTRDQTLLGGEQFVPRKKGGSWLIFQRVEVTDPADVYNTVAKMAKKRAHVDATLTATAASDIFEQDLEDTPEVVQPREAKARHRPGKDAVNKNEADADPRKRDALIADLEAVAEEGTDRLLEVWQRMSEDDRTLVGSEFGAIKKVAAQHD